METIAAWTSGWFSQQGWDKISFYASVAAAILGCAFAITIVLARTNSNYLKEQAAGPRSVNPAQQQELAAAPTPVPILVVSIGQEGAAYANQIIEALGSKWDVARFQIGVAVGIQPGITIIGNGGNSKPVKAALDTAKIQYHDAGDNGMVPIPLSVRPNYAGRVVIVVGTKP